MFRLVGLAGAFSLLATMAMAGEKVRMATISPGSSAYLVMTSMASVVNQRQNRYDIIVDARGAATKHMLDAGQGKLDLVMSSPDIMKFMSDGEAMYSQVPTAPELRKNLGLMFWFPYGAVHVVTMADSSIQSLDDIRDKQVFLGPPGGGAYNTAASWIKAVTGMDAGVDYQPVEASWGEAYQGFIAGDFDVYINGGIPPFPQIEKLASVGKLRLLGIDRALAKDRNSEAYRLANTQGALMDVIPAGAYGDKVVNSSDVYTIGSRVGVIARLDMPQEAVYEITKTFWQALPQLQSDEAFMNKVTLQGAVDDMGVRLHPGALKYYKEIGLAVPNAVQ